MRSDMSKLITECYREGGGKEYRQHRHQMKRIDPDDAPKRESIRKWTDEVGYGRKEFGENLNPLRRYLLGQVGRPWNNVHSEMSAQINRNSATQLHIWQHAVDYVEQNCYFDDNGKVRFFGRYQGDEPIEDSYAEVYVCPSSGILKKVPKKKREKYKPRVYQPIIVDKCHQLHRMNGIWYEITLADEPKGKWVPYTAEEFRRWSYLVPRGAGRWTGIFFREVAAHELDREYKLTDKYHWKPSQNPAEVAYKRKGVYGQRKRQLSSKELRRHGLVNKSMEVPQRKKVA